MVGEEVDVVLFVCCLLGWRAQPARRVSTSTPLLDRQRRCGCFLATPTRPMYLCIALSRHYVVTHTCDFQSKTHQDAARAKRLRRKETNRRPVVTFPFVPPLREKFSRR